MSYVPIKQVVVKCSGQVSRLASKTKGNVTGIPTGFIDLDYKLSGLQPSDLILMAARPSMGKTAFVLNIAQYAAFREEYGRGNLQSGDVKGTAGKPSVFPGVPGGCPGSSVPVTCRTQTGRSSSRARAPSASQT